jgi:hypothetical protein
MVVSYMVSGPLLAKGRRTLFREELATGLHLPILMPDGHAYRNLFGCCSPSFCIFISNTVRAASPSTSSGAIARLPAMPVSRSSGNRHRDGSRRCACGTWRSEIIGLGTDWFAMFSAGYVGSGRHRRRTAGVQPLLILLSGISSRPQGWRWQHAARGRS